MAVGTLALARFHEYASPFAARARFDRTTPGRVAPRDSRVLDARADSRRTENSGSWARLLELQPASPRFHADPVPRDELAAEDGLRQRVLHLLLDGTLERTRAVHRVVTRLAQPVQRRIVEAQLEVAIQQATLELRELDIHDGADLVGAERTEHA